MRETTMQRKCMQWAKTDRDLLPVNMHGDGYANKGFPDLLVFGDGKCVAIELKSDSGYKFQSDQKIWRKRLMRAGIAHHVANSLDEFKSVIDKEFGNATQRGISRL